MSGASRAIDGFAIPMSPSRPQEAARPGGGVVSVRALWLVVAVIIFVAWFIHHNGIMEAGSDVGYYLGVVGGSMMLLLLLYPLRKRIGWLRALGGLRYWFAIHMFLGIAGPSLILFHAGFNAGSLNAAVALYSMLLVAGSGLIGRFIYTRIHHGLYGRKASLQELQARLGLAEGEVKSRFHFAPQVESRLRAFEERALSQTANPIANAWWLSTLSLRAYWLRKRCLYELKSLLSKHAVRHDWDRAKLRRRIGSARRLLDSYMRTVQDVAQFGTYERLFSLWHVAHVPFVFLLVVSGVVHVIAVHMY